MRSSALGVARGAARPARGRSRASPGSAWRPTSGSVGPICSMRDHPVGERGLVLDWGTPSMCGDHPHREVLGVVGGAHRPSPPARRASSISSSAIVAGQRLEPVDALRRERGQQEPASGRVERRVRRDRRRHEQLVADQRRRRPRRGTRSARCRGRSRRCPRSGVGIQEPPWRSVWATGQLVAQLAPDA